MIAMLPGVSAREVEISLGTLSKTAIRNGVWVAHIHDDALWLDKPISVTTTLGELTFAAHAGLDGRIDLRMALKIDDDDDHTLEAAETGTWSDPVITTTNLDAAGPWRKGADAVQKQVNDFTDALTRWFGTGSVEP